MKTIYKYPLQLLDEQGIVMPKGAVPLTVQLQFDAPCFWALVETNGPVVERMVYIYGTGYSVGDDKQYIGSFQLYEGSYVGHVFIAEEK